MRKKGNVITEQPVVMMLIILAGLLILWGVVKLITLGRERGMAGLFGW